MLFCPSFTQSERSLHTDHLITRLRRVEPATCCSHDKLHSHVVEQRDRERVQVRCSDLVGSDLPQNTNLFLRRTSQGSIIFGKKFLPGMSLGYAVQAVSLRKGDILVADIKELENFGRVRNLCSETQHKGHCQASDNAEKMYHDRVSVIVSRATIFMENLVLRCYHVTEVFCPKYCIVSALPARSPCKHGSLADLAISVFRGVGINAVLPRLTLVGRSGSES